MKIKFSSFRFLFILVCIFLHSVGSKAQITTSIKVGSTDRAMIVYAPSGITQNNALVISMHGMNQTMTDQKNQTQFMAVANANNFVLVFPQAINNQWQLWGTVDTDFILAIIDEMSKLYGIDRDRVYLSGFSMGGMMTYYAATQIADKIAAFAPVSGFLMGGPDTNSSRAIPIIHIHGQDDGYVPYANVPTHMDAWVARNKCNPTPVITNPYPISTAKSIKKYWAAGSEGVEVVMIGVADVGHWYSDNNWSADGIFSSQEIWNFCKKYSLKLGVPQFKYASVSDNAPKQIQLVLDKSITNASSYTGFTVKVDGQPVTISNVVLTDTNKMTINLPASLLKSNEIRLSYSNGNVLSTLNKKLISFTDTLVDNQLKGAAPRIIEAKTDVPGNNLIAKFNMKMKLPADLSALSLNATYNGQINIPVVQCSFYNNDSTTLLFSLNQKVYRDYSLSLSYSGNNIVSADGGLMAATNNVPITNFSNGLPVHFSSGTISADATTLTLNFSKKMVLTSGQSSSLILSANGKAVGYKSFSVSNNIIQFVLLKSIHSGDNVALSYTPGSITAADNGALEAISNLAISNQVADPAWIGIPSKIEAENYTYKLGMQAETTTDAGGGQDLGYIGTGDWAEYAIDNNTVTTDYQISFRLAAQSSGAIVSFYIDDVLASTINVPSTGGWQVYQSTVKNVSISQGKHYLKVVATNAGFNFNYMDVTASPSGINDAANDENVTVYPNRTSNELVINSANFKHNRIEIFDATGSLLLSRATAGESVLHIPVHLSNGIYLVKVSDGAEYRLRKILY